MALFGFIMFGLLAAILPRELPRLPILYTTIAFGCMYGAWLFLTRSRPPA
jgi:hypothetical protein